MNIFIAFAKEDHDVRDKLLRQMNLVKDRLGWNIWSAKEIKAGERWDEEIKQRLMDYEVVILLLSTDFFNSKYIVETELPKVVEKHKKGNCQIIPVIARVCHWKDTPFGEYAELGDIQALPVGEKPIMSKDWNHEDDPYFEVVAGIKDSIRAFQLNKKESVKGNSLNNESPSIHELNRENERLTQFFLEQTHVKKTITDENLSTIETNQVRGPLVILFGPRNVGKTVAILRLSHYLIDYDILPDQNFRTDYENYRATIAPFEKIINLYGIAPPATGLSNFLMLNVVNKGRQFCQILDAAGEQFFDSDKPEAVYPPYFNKILHEDYCKVFLFFFSPNMFNNDKAYEQYCEKISHLINTRISAQRDKIVFVYSKCDLEPYYKNGSPIVEEYKKKIFSYPGFSKMFETLKMSGFKQVDVLPFSAGYFSDAGSGQILMTFSHNNHPKFLWDVIVGGMKKEVTWWKFW